jgi:hypothetical protein
VGHRGDDVLLSDEPAVKQGQAGHHEEDKGTRHEHPRSVPCVYWHTRDLSLVTLTLKIFLEE